MIVAMYICMYISINIDCNLFYVNSGYLKKRKKNACVNCELLTSNQKLEPRKWSTQVERVQIFTKRVRHYIIWEFLLNSCKNKNKNKIK